MGLFSSKKSSSAVTNSTTNNFVDESANAGGDGSVALTQGSSLTINNLDGGAVANALSANATVSNYAISSVSAVADSAIAAQNANTANALEFASGALDLNAKNTSAALGFASTQNERVLDFIGETSGSLIQNADRERIANQDLTASLARSAFALADEKTQSADDKVFNLGRTLVYAAAALIALFVLFRRPSKA